MFFNHSCKFNRLLSNNVWIPRNIYEQIIYTFTEISDFNGIIKKKKSTSDIISGKSIINLHICYLSSIIW